MQYNDGFVSQYGAGLTMLHNAITACDDALWYDTDCRNPVWRVAYHVVFYTDLYLSTDEKQFVAWEKHHADYEMLGETTPWPPHRALKIGEPYTKTEILAYCLQLRDALAERLEPLDANAPSGFSWLPFTKFELQLYNIRHLQHHTGQLIDRLKETRNVAVNWIGLTTA